MNVSGGKDQGVRHPQRQVLRSQLRRPFCNDTVDAENLFDDLLKEATHRFLLVMPDACAGEQLGVGDDRHDE